MLDDENIKKKTAAAVWGVIGNMFLPAFLFKSSPSASKADAELQSLPTAANRENESSPNKPSPWYHFSGVLGWVLPSFRKPPGDSAPTHHNANSARLSEASPESASPSLSSADSGSSSQQISHGPGSAASNEVRALRSGTPSAVVPITRDTSSESNSFCNSNRAQSMQIPALPPHFSLLVPPSPADEGDNSFTDDDRRGTSNGEQKS